MKRVHEKRRKRIKQKNYSREYRLKNGLVKCSVPDFPSDDDGTNDIHRQLEPTPAMIQHPYGYGPYGYGLYGYGPYGYGPYVCTHQTSCPLSLLPAPQTPKPKNNSQQSPLPDNCGPLQNIPATMGHSAGQQKPKKRNDELMQLKSCDLKNCLPVGKRPRRAPERLHESCSRSDWPDDFPDGETQSSSSNSSFSDSDCSLGEMDDRSLELKCTSLNKRSVTKRNHALLAQSSSGKAINDKGSLSATFHKSVRIDENYVICSKVKKVAGHRLFAEVSRYDVGKSNTGQEGTSLELSQPIYYHVKLGTSVPRNPVFIIDLSRGGQLTFSAGSISAATCQAIADELYTCRLWKEHLLDTPSGCQKEPRLHFLASHDTRTGYVYSRLKMKSESIDSLPETKKLEQELSNQYQTTFPVGVDCLLYRDGNDYIGFHADDTQGEDLIVSVTVQSEQVRKLRIKVAERRRGPGMIKKILGDEVITLHPRAGDVYTMDGVMQQNYVHGILACSQRKDEKGMVHGAKGNRIAMIFRSGNRLEVKEDHGTLVTDLRGVIREPIKTHVDPIADLVPGKCYTKQKLKDMGAHTNYPGGVSGRSETGADSICVVRNCAKMREYDWGSHILYTSNSSQRGPALLKSFKDDLWCRVFRASQGTSPFRPNPTQENKKKNLYRYDGKYRVVQAWDMLGRPCLGKDKDLRIDKSKPKPKATMVYTFLLEFWPEKNQGNLTLPRKVRGLRSTFCIFAHLEAFPANTFDERGNLKVTPSKSLVRSIL